MFFGAEPTADAHPRSTGTHVWDPSRAAAQIQSNKALKNGQKGLRKKKKTITDVKFLKHSFSFTYLHCRNLVALCG